MTKIILFAQQTNTNHPALGPIFEVTFTDDTTVKMYAETFFDQLDWKPDQPLEGYVIDLDKAYVC